MVRYTGYVVLFAIVVLMAGCAKLPQAEVEAAEAAVEDAEAADADTYAAGAFALARSALAELDIEVALQADKSAAARKYDTAVALAAEAKKAAEDAKTAAADRKAELAVQLAVDLETLERELTSAEATVKKAFTIKGIKLDREAIENALDGVKVLTDQARSDISNGALLNAQGTLLDALERLAETEMTVGAAAVNTR